MDREVQLLVEGIHGSGEYQQVVNTKATGRLVKKKDNYYLLYDEILEQEDKNATPLIVHNRMKWGAKELEVVRTGVVDSRMLFLPGRFCRTEYPTPMGIIMLDIYTETICRETEILENCGGELPQEIVWEVTYHLVQNTSEEEPSLSLIGGEDASKIRVHIR